MPDPHTVPWTPTPCAGPLPRTLDPCPCVLDTHTRPPTPQARAQLHTLNSHPTHGTPALHNRSLPYMLDPYTRPPPCTPDAHFMCHPMRQTPTPRILDHHPTYQTPTARLGLGFQGGGLEVGMPPPTHPTMAGSRAPSLPSSSGTRTWTSLSCSTMRRRCPVPSPLPSLHQASPPTSTSIPVRPRPPHVPPKPPHSPRH